MNKLEALADALASLNEYSDPDSVAYSLRNPGLLKAFTLRHEMDDQSRRIFPSFVDGYQALLYDLQVKCSGRSRSKLKPESTLEDLLVRGYSQPKNAVEFVIQFLASALPKQNVTERTPLAFFAQHGGK